MPKRNDAGDGYSAGFIADGVAQCRDYGMELPFVLFA